MSEMLAIMMLSTVCFTKWGAHSECRILLSKLNSKGCEGVMSTSWQATLMSLCIGKGMDGQLGSVLIRAIISDNATQYPV